jgi:hypothetical protein
MLAASLIVISVTSLSMFYRKVTILRPMHTSIFTGEAWIQELLTHRASSKVSQSDENEEICVFPALS